MSATRLVQIRNGPERRVALVVEDELRLLAGSASVYELAEQALAADRTLTALVAERATGDGMDYAAVYAGVSPWRLLPPIDHPAEPTRCLVSGTGLTHMGSARDRQAMHNTAPEEVTDSMRMFRSGLEGGRPEPGRIGTAPEWFYKGTGTILRAHGEPLLVPSYAEDGGEEAEVAGVYVVDSEGRPRRLGMAVGNEFSDHRFERKNYLNLAGSKLRTCSLGPELAVDPGFDSVPGRVSLERAGNVLWSKEIRTGEAEMCHSLQNVEHHHFKFEAHRRPGDLHVHFFGAHGLSFGDGVELRDGDVMEIRFEGFGRALRNPVSVSRAADPLVKVQPLG
ncbi:MAG TPA: AraD1 family protein [Vicinamibacteria bacterium]